MLWAAEVTGKGHLNQMKDRRGWLQWALFYRTKKCFIYINEPHLAQ